MSSRSQPRAEEARTCKAPPPPVGWGIEREGHGEGGAWGGRGMERAARSLSWCGLLRGARNFRHATTPCVRHAAEKDGRRRVCLCGVGISSQCATEAGQNESPLRVVARSVLTRRHRTADAKAKVVAASGRPVAGAVSDMRATREPYTYAQVSAWGTCVNQRV